ncbi:hypothetical protein EIN_507490 [Entamoeba invadens IP1]|uniref:Uncharacterized protein n=1 Tax=Entamoeba invadens IP1 TaxID=370355 RepID=A0A0A1UC73_ENTIV|nr:hypothetical protein EIN_507490 [Entamoeba invadens IP1]ELP92848.1 hypothetical protein EIN_507490 [Entamoeba invadens IP1]|eukprot:XP_004259619.1 hypothetical protein EIN_507490 [Entamoeba invadens IP1]
MTEIDVYLALKNVPNVNSYFESLNKSLDEHLITPQPTLPLDLSTLDFETSIQKLNEFLTLEEICEENCLTFSKSIKRVLAVLSDVTSLCKLVKAKCEEDGKHIVTARNTAIQMVIEKEKSRCDKELATNTLRKAQIKVDFEDKVSELTQKMKNSIFPLNFDYMNFFDKIEPPKIVVNHNIVENLIPTVITAENSLKVDQLENLENDVQQPKLLKVFKSTQTEDCNTKVINLEHTEHVTKNTNLFPSKNFNQSETIDKQNDMNKQKNTHDNLSDKNTLKNKDEDKHEKKTLVLKKVNTDPINNGLKLHSESDEISDMLHENFSQSVPQTTSDAFKPSNKENTEKMKKSEFSLTEEDLIDDLDFLPSNPFVPTEDSKDSKEKTLSEISKKHPESSKSSKESREDTEVMGGQLPRVKDKKCYISPGVLTMEDKAQIFAWSRRSVGRVLFDYASDLPKRTPKALVENLKGVRGFVIVIYSQDANNVFGVVVTKPAEKPGFFVRDEKCCIFSLKREGIVKRKKFEILSDCANFAFLVGKERSTKFFDVGKGDIKIWRNKEEKLISASKRRSFEYGKESKTVTGKNELYEIEIQGFTVFELEKE